MKSLCCKGQECQAKCLLLPFFLGFVDVNLDPFALDLTPLADLAPLVTVLDLLVLAMALFVVVALDWFVADLATFVADDDLDPFVLASCAARLASNSCLFEQPVAAKIRLTVGEVSSSSSMVERKALEALGIAVALVNEREDAGGSCDEKAIELLVGTFFLVTYGLIAVLRRRRDRHAAPSFSLSLR